MKKDSSQILSDHTRHKSKFIPPLISKLNNIQETSWTKIGLPELVWISLLNHYLGTKNGADVALKFTKMCAEECANKMMGTMTSFKLLSVEAKDRINTKIRANDIHSQLLFGLGGLLAFYPECPLAFITTEKERTQYKNEIALKGLMNAVQPLFDKYEKECTFTYATLFYIGTLQGKIKVAPHLSLTKFPEIESYPHTKLSREIASGLRAMMPMITGGMGQDVTEIDEEWPNYFWDRGLEISPCSGKDRL